MLALDVNPFCADHDQTLQDSGPIPYLNSSHNFLVSINEGLEVQKIINKWTERKKQSIDRYIRKYFKISR